MSRRLTWQNIAAPDVGLSGIRAASGMFGDALQGIQAGLANFQETRQKQADSSALAQALQYSDPDTYQRALASGSLFNGRDPSQLSASVLETLGNRSNNLLRDATARENLDQSRYTHTRQKSQDEAIDAASGDVARLFAMGASGQEVGSFLMNSPALRGLSPDQLGSIMNNASSLLSGRTSRDSTRQSMAQSRQSHANSLAEFSNRQSDRAAKEAIQGHLAFVYNNASNPYAVRDYVNNSNLPNHHKAALMEESNRLVPGLFPGVYSDQLMKMNSSSGSRGSGKGTDTSPSNQDLSQAELLDSAQAQAYLGASTNNINVANILSNALKESPKTPAEVARELSEDFPNLDYGRRLKMVNERISQTGMNPNVVGAALKLSATENENLMSTAGRNDPILGARIPFLPEGINTISDWIGAPINMIGDALMGSRVEPNESRFNEIISTLRAGSSDSPTMLGDRSTGVQNTNLPQRMINDIVKSSAARKAIEKATEAGLPEEVIFKMFSDNVETENSLADTVRKLNDLTRTYKK